MDDYKGTSNVQQLLSKRPKTPNIDRLAARGTIFRNAHAQFSMCGPSRASFLSSLRPDTTGCRGLGRNALGIVYKSNLRSGQVLATIPRLFKDNGYLVYGVGKIFHENEDILMQDPDLWTVPVYTWKDGYARPPTFTTPYQGAWIASPSVPDNFFPDGQAGVFSRSLINSLVNQTKPWALFVGLWKPHMPWAAPQRFFTMQGGGFPGPHHSGVPAGLQSQDWQMIRGIGCLEGNDYIGAPNNLAGWAVSGAVAQAAAQAYYATVSYADAQIGLLLDAIDRSVDANNTHVVLIGDHGFHLGDHGLYCKHTNMLGGTQTMLMVAPAQNERGWARNFASVAPVELLDVMPTLADMFGFAFPNAVNKYLPWEGVSLAPIMTRRAQWVKFGAMFQYFRGQGKNQIWGYGLRTVRYRFTFWCPGLGGSPSGACVKEMYDMMVDRYEGTSIHKTRTADIFDAVRWSSGQRWNLLRGVSPPDWSSSGGMAAQFASSVLP